jgi:hypothetical protein
MRHTLKDVMYKEPEDWENWLFWAFLILLGISVIYKLIKSI